MRSFILVAVVLQLAAIITHSTGQYNFGDIIAFPRNCDNNNRPGFIHFGVYVGGQNVPDVGQGDNNIFELQRQGVRAVCGFGQLQEIRQGMREVLLNYLDNNNNYREQATPQLIADRIRAVPRDCGLYLLPTNNCEHMATRMRYNQKLCLQLGAKAERGARLIAPREALQAAEGRVVCEPLQA